MYESVVSYPAPAEDRYAMASLDKLICDILMLVEPLYFVGTLSSQVSRLVLELRSAREGGHNAFRVLASLDDYYYKSLQPTDRLVPHHRKKA